MSGRSLRAPTTHNQHYSLSFPILEYSSSYSNIALTVGSLEVCTAHNSPAHESLCGGAIIGMKPDAGI